MAIKFKYALLITLVLSFLTIILFKLQGGNIAGGENKDNSITKNKLEDVEFEVMTEEVVRGDLFQKIYANGIVKANKELIISSNISGYIMEVKIKEGDKVNKNEQLICIDNKEKKMDLIDAETRLEASKIQYLIQKKETILENNKDLNAGYNKEKHELENELVIGKINKDEYSKLLNIIETKYILAGGEREKYIEIKSGLAEAKNNYERAKLNMSYTSINAPFDGIISDMNPVVGKRIDIGEKLCKLLDINKVLIEVGVFENDIISIKPGNTVEVIFNSFPNEVFKGEVVFINPIIDPESKTCRVTVRLENLDLKIKPGMFASVNINSRKLSNRIIIPTKALLIRDKKAVVFVKEGNTAKWRYVSLGESNDEFVEIKNGVVPGEKVITEGNFTLAHGTRVKDIKQSLGNN